MPTRRNVQVLVAVIAGLLCTQAYVEAQGGRGATEPSPTAQAAAPFDMTGYWVSVIAQDWRVRMVVPPKGEYLGIPMLPAAKEVADAWDPEKDQATGNQCKGHGAAAIMRLPTRLHATWQDPNSLRIDIDAGTQTRLFHFGGRRSRGGAPTWQGESAASWVS